MVEEAALEATGLFKRYGDRLAVNGVDLSVRPGEVHGLLGPNGAGKTTVLRMLLGLVALDAGIVRLLGCAAGSTTAPLASGVAGFVDTPAFYPYLSGRRNLDLLARLDAAGPGSRGAERVRAALEGVGLADRADAKVGGYSAGMRQRLGLAAAMLREPRLLLLDEPTNSLDPAGARDLRASVRRLAAGGAAILLSSHDMAEVENLCSRLTIVHRGRVVFFGTVEELRKRAPAAIHRLRTSDDGGARSIGEDRPDVHVTPAIDGDGLDVSADETGLDEYVVALGRAGVAIRSLESRDHSLQSLFLRLTEEVDGDADSVPPRPAGPPVERASRGSYSGRALGPPSARGVFAVIRVEWGKLAAQLKAWAVLAVCLLGPFAFAVAVELQSSLPEDTLFGRGVRASGFAVPLLVLGFAATWAFPVLTSVVSGDLFSCEDRYGTWPTLLTRSRTRGEIFAGKVVTGLGFSLLAVTALAFGSIAAGVLVVGRQPLLGLSGTVLAPGRALALVAGAWASVLPPVFGFTALAVLVSVATRSSAAGVGLPLLIGFAMELCSYANGPDALRGMLLTPPFVGWHGLFTEHRYYGPLIQGTAVSGVYAIGCLTAAYHLFRRRDMGG